MPQSLDPIKTRHRENAQKDFISQLVAKAQRDKFYGKITLLLEGGNVRRILREESIKPPA